MASCHRCTYYPVIAPLQNRAKPAFLPPCNTSIQYILAAALYASTDQSSANETLQKDYTIGLLQQQKNTNIKTVAIMEGGECD